MEGGTTPRMCCYRCTRCQLDVYRHSVHYDRRDRPICDPDCDGSKPGVCIWCEHVIVGRPMLMFDKKVHRECWQYCVAKFGYDAIVRRYSSADDVKKLREKEVGEDMVREMVEEFFDKFCYEILCDEEDGSSGEHELSVRRRDFRGKEGELEWGRAIRRVLRNQDNTSGMTCANESKINEDANQWRGLSEGESVGCGSGRTEGYYDEMTLKELLAEPTNDKGNALDLHRVHSSEEREKWLQAVEASLCGDKFFNRESWADSMYSNTATGHVVEKTGRGSTASNSTSFYEDQQIFVDRIIDEAVDVVKECIDENLYKRSNDHRIINKNAVFERATRPRNDALMMGANLDGEFVDKRNVPGQTTLLVNGLIDKAAKDYLDTSDEELENGVRENLLASREYSEEDEQIKCRFSNSWAEASKFKSMYQKVTDECESYEGRCFEREDTGERQSNLSLYDESEAIDDSEKPSQTSVSDDKTKSSKKKRNRRKKRKDIDTSDREPSDLKLNLSDLVSDCESHEDSVDKKNNLLCDSNLLNATDSDRTTGKDQIDTSKILKEEQLDEMFRNALVTSSDPGRLGGLINDFKNAVGDIQLNDPDCFDSVTEHFDTLLSTLLEHVTELDNSILIFRKYARPDHLCDKSLDSGLVSSPQGEVYGTKNVLIIFDYGEECLKSDIASVYEFLSNLNQDQEDTSNPIHQEDSDISGRINGNVNDYGGVDTTCGANCLFKAGDVTDEVNSTCDASCVLKHFNTEVSPTLASPKTSSDFDNITTYEETFWSQVENDFTNNLEERDRIIEELFGTEGEEQAWAAMLKDGVHEDIAGEIVASAETMNRQNAKDTLEISNTNSRLESNKLLPSPKIKPSDTCNRLKTSMLSHGKAISNGNPNKQTDAMLLDRLRSIKRINFDDSVTNLKAAGELHNSCVVRKSVSESDVYSYEMCACTRYPSSDDTSLGGAESVCTWTEERHIVTEEAPKHLHHSVSLGASKTPVDVYEIAIEITINKKNDDKDTRNLKCGRSTSIVDLMPFLKEWTDRKKAMNESIPNIAIEPNIEYRSQLDSSTIESNKNKPNVSEKTQSDIVHNKHYEQNDSNVTAISKSEGETPNKNFCEDSFTNGLGSCGKDVPDSSLLQDENDHAKRSGDSVLFGRSVKELGDVGTQSELNVPWVVPNNTMKTEYSESNHSKRLSIHEIPLKKSFREVNIERSNEHKAELARSSQVGVDVDLFFDDPIRHLPTTKKCPLVKARKPDGSIFDYTDSTEDLFPTGLIVNKRDLETSEDLDVIPITPASDKELVCLKERNENFKYETSSNKELFSQEETASDLHKNTNEHDIMDTQTSANVGNHSYGHNMDTLGLKYDEINRRPSNTGNQFESLGGEVIKPKISERCQIDVEIPLCTDDIYDQNSSTEHIKGKMLENVTNFEVNASGLSNTAGEVISKDTSKSPEINTENADLKRSVKDSTSKQDTSDTLGLEADTQHSSEIKTILQDSKTPDVDFKSVAKEVNFLKPTREPDISLQASLQSDDNYLKDPEITGDTLVENALLTKSTTEQIHIPSTTVQQDNNLKPAQESDCVSDSVRSISDLVSKGSKSDNLKELDIYSLVEQEMVCFDLTEEKGQLYVLGTGLNQAGAIKSSPKIRKLSPGRRNNCQEVGHCGIKDLGFGIKGEFDSENYAGDSTDNEEEVGVVSEGSEYGVDHEWPIQSCSETWDEPPDATSPAPCSSRSKGDGADPPVRVEATSRGPPVRTGTLTLGKEYGEIDEALMSEADSSKGLELDKKEKKGKKNKKEKKDKKKKEKKDKKKECKDGGGRRKSSHTCVVL